MATSGKVNWIESSYLFKKTDTEFVISHAAAITERDLSNLSCVFLCIEWGKSPARFL